MAIQPAPLQPGLAIPTAGTPLYVTPPNSTAVVKRAVLSNTTPGPISVTIAIQRAGVSLVASLTIMTRTLPGNTTDLLPELANFVMVTGDAMNVSATAPGVNAFISGFVL